MKQFKVLMSSGIIVDEKHLGRGIYEAAIPVLRLADETMDSMVQKVLSAPVRHESVDAVMRNLKLCTLEDVWLSDFDYVAFPAENLAGEELSTEEIVSCETSETEELAKKKVSSGKKVSGAKAKSKKKK